MDQYFYTIDNNDEFKAICNSITEKVDLLALEYEDYSIKGYWEVYTKGNEASFYITDECQDLVIARKIRSVFKDAISPS